MEETGIDSANTGYKSRADNPKYLNKIDRVLHNIYIAFTYTL